MHESLDTARWRAPAAPARLPLAGLLALVALFAGFASACDDGGTDPEDADSAVLDASIDALADATTDGGIDTDSPPDLVDATTETDTRVATDTSTTAPDADLADAVDMVDATMDADVGPPLCGGQACAAPMTCCDDVCVDLEASDAHCGGCGLACPAGERCDAGFCECGGGVSCEPFGDACCQDGSGLLSCRQISVDHSNCGACGVQCEFSESCFDGECVCPARDGALESCAGAESCCPNIGCRNLMNDPTSCGGCGIFCGPGESCVDGACTCGTSTQSGDGVCLPGEVCCGDPGECRAADDPICVCGTATCGTGQVCCDVAGASQACVRPASDLEHCGACGVACGLGETCSGGACVCQTGLSDCDGDPSNGCETSVLSDTANCGACGSPCPAGQVCDGTGRCAPNCQTGLLFCSGECIDATNDGRYCGDCQTACPAGEVCDGSGQCQVQCQVGRTECLTSNGVACKDLLSDHTACGSCTERCGLALVCDGHGTCDLTCQPGLTECNRDCINPDWNRTHCGACGVSCGPGEVCNGGGQCAPTCLPGLTNCGGNCVDLDTEFAFCGACGVQCLPGQLCSDGQCTTTCPAGTQSCLGADGVRRCVDPTSENAHCGGCGIACAATETCVDGTCVDGCPSGTALCPSGLCADFTSDPLNCGSCGTACLPGEVCALGMSGTGECTSVPTCLPPRTECGNACVALQSNPYHCGACGNACQPTQVCVGGSCACPASLADCDMPADGVCETFLGTDPANCGGCGIACGADESCSGGVCSCPFGLVDSDGDGTCDVTIFTDPANCGTLGTTCGASETCAAGRCTSPLTDRVDLAANTGDASGCGIDATGAVWCWGDGDSGQLGDGASRFALDFPVPVVGIDGMSASAVDVGVGHDFACAVLSDGAVRCWGQGSDRQLGCGADTATCKSIQTAPVNVVGIDGIAASAVSVDGGDRFACALLVGGAVQCWGVDWSGELGNGAGGFQDVPGTVEGLDGTTPVGQLVVGSNHACARLSTGEVRCWGNNFYGKLGDTTTTNAHSPVTPVGFDGVTRSAVWIAAGDANTCAIDSTGATDCWGEGDVSRTASAVSTPTPIPELDGTSNATTALEIAIGSRHACAATVDGLVRCWGDDAFVVAGGVCPSTGGAGLAPTQIGPLTLGNLAAGAATCGVAADGSIACFGLNDEGQLGSGGLLATNPVPRPVAWPAAPPTVIELVGSPHGASNPGGYCALTDQATARCWGANGSFSSNQISYLGIGIDGPTQSTPAPLALGDVAEVALGSVGGCARTHDGRVWCWGGGNTLGLSDGPSFTTQPVLLSFFDGNARSAVALTLGESHACAVLTDGRVACWGSSSQRAHGSTTTLLDTPRFVSGFGPGALIATSVAASTSRSTCAITDTGAAYCWGSNFSGALGNGDTSIALTEVPQPVVGLDGVADAALEIAGGNLFFCARLATGALRCWGENGRGQLGNSSTTDSDVPVDVVGFDGTTRAAVALAIGHETPCVIDANGAVACWGQHTAYQLTDEYPAGTSLGTCASSCIAPAVCTGFSCGYGVPVDLTRFDGATLGAIDIASTAGSTCVLTDTNEIMCWGNNTQGSLGRGGLAYTCTPTPVEIP